MRLGVIICAGGSSTRYSGGDAGALGGGRSKLDEDLGGRPVLQRSVELFSTLETRADLSLPDGEAEIADIIVVGPADDDAFDDFRMKHGDRVSLLGGRVVPGGATRAGSAKAGLDALERTNQRDNEITHALIHDAARAITPPALIERVIRAGGEHGAAVPGVPAPDTIKRVGDEVTGASADPLAGILGSDAGGSDDAKARAVLGTVDREGLILAQTPQCFELALLRAAYTQPGFENATDDASLVERLITAGETNATLVSVEGDPANLKITRPGDMAVIRALGGYKTDSGRPTHKRF